MTERTVLAQRLWDLKENGEGLSYSKMVARSGGKVSISTLHSVMHGNVRELTPDTIAGLALILNVSEAYVLAALKNQELSEGEQLTSELEQLNKYFLEVPREYQLDILALVESLWMRRRVEGRAEKIANQKHKGRRRDVAATTPQQPASTARPAEQLGDEENDENGPLRRTA